MKVAAAAGEIRLFKLRRDTDWRPLLVDVEICDRNGESCRGQTTKTNHCNEYFNDQFI